MVLLETRRYGMAHIQWKERYNINYKEVDAQHKRLLDILNHLLELIQCKRAADEISTIFHRLCTYAVDHFTLEERYLERSGYPDLARQQEEHGYFVGKILEFNDRYDPADPAFLLETFEFLKTWYLRHILRTDMEYVPWLRRFHREARIQGILVDFGSLLSRSAPGNLLAALASLTGQPEALLHQRLFEESLFADFQAGALDRGAFLEELALPGLDEALLAQAFTGMYLPLTENLDLLTALKADYRLGLVANSHPWHADQVLQACPILGLFDTVSLSHETKALLPDHRLLNDALDKLGLMSEECLFLTGSSEHAAAAERWCFQALAFREPAEVWSFLKRRS